MSTRKQSDGLLVMAESEVTTVRPSEPSLEALRRDLEELGLSTYEARVVLALFRSGSATPARLARLADVPRTSTYQVLEELHSQGLAERIPGDGPAVWVSRGPEEVLARLESAQEERLRQHRSRSDRVRDTLTQVLSEAPAAVMPYVQVIHEPARVKPLYEQMLADAREELLVFNRPPYSWTLGVPNPVILEIAGRVPTRVLYQASQVTDPAGDLWRQEMEAYHAAGAQGRVMPDLPLKLAVVDRKVALLTIDDPVLAHVGFPTSLLVEHPSFASVQANSFEFLWATATPYDEVRARSTR